MGEKIKFIDIYIIVMFLLAVYFILTRIFGHSATDITISSTLFTALGILIYKLNREFGEFKIKTIYSFEKIREEFKEVRKDIKEIKTDIKFLKSRA